MKKTERIMLHLVNAVVIVFVCFSVCFLAVYPIGSSFSPIIGMIGLAAGFVIWRICRVRLLNLLLHNTVYQLAANCILMVGIFGFFMGVPVFNVLPGILAAYIIGLNARIGQSSADEYKSKMRRVQWSTLIILSVFLIASAAIALLDPYTGRNLQGMFGLNGEVTRSQIILIIVVGGMGLITIQWLLERVIGKRAYTVKN